MGNRKVPLLLILSGLLVLAVLQLSSDQGSTSELVSVIRCTISSDNCSMTSSTQVDGPLPSARRISKSSIELVFPRPATAAPKAAIVSKERKASANPPRQTVRRKSDSFGLKSLSASLKSGHSKMTSKAKKIGASIKREESKLNQLMKQVRKISREAKKHHRKIIQDVRRLNRKAVRANGERQGPRGQRGERGPRGVRGRAGRNIRLPKPPARPIPVVPPPAASAATPPVQRPAAAAPAPPAPKAIVGTQGGKMAQTQSVRKSVSPPPVARASQSVVKAGQKSVGKTSDKVASAAEEKEMKEWETRVENMFRKYTKKIDDLNRAAGKEAATRRRSGTKSSSKNQVTRAEFERRFDELKKMIAEKRGVVVAAKAKAKTDVCVDCDAKAKGALEKVQTRMESEIAQAVSEMQKFLDTKLKTVKSWKPRTPIKKKK